MQRCELLFFIPKQTRKVNNVRNTKSKTQNINILSSLNFFFISAIDYDSMAVTVNFPNVSDWKGKTNQLQHAP